MRKQMVRAAIAVISVTLLLVLVALLTMHTDAVEMECEIVYPSESDAEVIAQILYYECRYLSELEQSAVVWVILNRVDSPLSYFPDTVYEVCTQRMGGTYMFAYRADAPVQEDLYILAMDVLQRWCDEKNGHGNVGRTLPPEYVYFWGNGKRNFFRIEYQGNEYWDWSLPDPYAEIENNSGGY